MIDIDTGITPSSIFTLSGSTITLLTTNPLDMGTYHIRLIGYVGSYATAYEDVTVILANSCDATSITTVPIIPY